MCCASGVPWLFEGTLLPEGDVGRVVLPGPEPIVTLPGRYALRGLVDGVRQGLGRRPRPAHEVLAGLGEITSGVRCIDEAAGR